MRSKKKILLVHPNLIALGGATAVAAWIVEALKDEFDILVRQQGRCGLDGGAIFPAGVLDPLQLGFVVAIKGIGDQLVAQQVEVDISGNLRRTPGCGETGGIGQLAKLPARIQRHDLSLSLGIGGNHGKHGTQKNAEKNREFMHNGSRE